MAQTIRRLSVPIALFWLAVAALTNAVVPQLEEVGTAHRVSQSPQDAPSLQAMERMGKVFQEFDSDSAAMIVLEGDQPLGDDAHQQDRAADLLKQADEIGKTIDLLGQQLAIQRELNAATADQTARFHDTVATTKALRDKIANFDDFFRPSTTS
jgi:uncharacterized membrane protein YdfJ with MMPL/SSD domain